jgi:hypothetical protein
MNYETNSTSSQWTVKVQEDFVQYKASGPQIWGFMFSTIEWLG